MMPPQSSSSNLSQSPSSMQSTSSDLELEVTTIGFANNKLPPALYIYHVDFGKASPEVSFRWDLWNSTIRKQTLGPYTIWDGVDTAWSRERLLSPQFHVSVQTNVGMMGKRGAKFKTYTVTLTLKKMLTCPTKATISKTEQDSASKTNTIEYQSFLLALLQQTAIESGEFSLTKGVIYPQSGQYRKTVKSAGHRLDGLMEIVEGIHIRPQQYAEGYRLEARLETAVFWRTLMLLDIVTNVTPPPKQSSRIVHGRMSSDVFESVRRGLSYKPHVYITLGERDVSLAVAWSWNCSPLIWKTTAGHIRDNWEEVKQQRHFERYLDFEHYTDPRSGPFPVVLLTKGKIRKYVPIHLVALLPNIPVHNDLLSESGLKDELRSSLLPIWKSAVLQQHLTALSSCASQVLDRYDFHMSFDTSSVNARVLPKPILMLGNGVQMPVEGVRWNIKDQMYFKKSDKTLKSWGIGFMPGRIKPYREQIDQITGKVLDLYVRCTGDTAAPKPFVMSLPGDAGVAVQQLFTGTGDHFQSYPQLLVILVQDHRSFNYRQLKLNCDARYGVASQLLQMRKLMACPPQYLSTAMPQMVAKLGGVPWRTKSGGASHVAHLIIGAVNMKVYWLWPPEPRYIRVLTVSFDENAARYVAACEEPSTDAAGIQTIYLLDSVHKILSKYLEQIDMESMPEQVYYLRDVTDGTAAEDILGEANAIETTIREVGSESAWRVNITAIACSDSSELFETQQDGSAPPIGTLLDRASESDGSNVFCLHTGRQGKHGPLPTRYEVVRDDASHGGDVLAQFVYDQCCQQLHTQTMAPYPAAIMCARRAVERMKVRESYGGGGGQPKILPLNGRAGYQWMPWYI